MTDINSAVAYVQGFRPEKAKGTLAADLELIGSLIGVIRANLDNFDKTKFEDISKLVDTIYSAADDAGVKLQEVVERINGEEV